uniref:DUF4817 domain-containing protein n=1 Tax=Globodera pallida TaxID=36090 RepID=A0A183C1G0_GLOPA
MTSSVNYDQMREMTRDFLFQGVSAVETNALFQEKFGVENSPTLCTIYKWRREHRGGVCSTDVRPTLSVRQDDCTWFGHSVAASLRQMPIHTKELAKTRIQQVIYECTSPSVQEAVMDTGANVKEGSSHRIAGFEGVGKESFSLRSF